MIDRRLRAFGLAPALAYPVCLLGFVGLSLYLFYKTPQAPYIYPVLGLSLLGSLSKKERNDFLQYCFPLQHYRRIRLLENLFLVLPFVLFLLWKGAFLISLVLTVVAGLLSLVKTGSFSNYRLPTPFYRYPFEFTVGFRKTFPFFLLVYFVAIMGFWVDNFNLSIFALVVIFATALTFYTVPEAPFYVWIFAQEPGGFLKQKMGIAVVYANILALPIAVTTLILYPSFWWIILLALFFGSLFLVAVLLAKYADYPKEIGLPAAIFLSIALPLPPLLFLLIPYFYKKAMQRLKLILT